MDRPIFPKRVLITAGMPYGSKELHFGHVGGVFVQADTFARFMKDRIGKDNVIFVSGTDCYGSPIIEKHRTLVEEGKFNGSVEEFVNLNHTSQKDVLKEYLIDLSLFGASALGKGGECHAKFSRELFEQLYKSGYLITLSTKQFYDEDFHTFLNGRQVVGRCPIQGCKSEQAYADECSLGHQYFPEELIAPISTLSNKTPSLKEVKNWYLDLEKLAPFLQDLMKKWEVDPQVRPFITAICNEFLKAPVLYSKSENFEQISKLLKENNIEFKSELEEQKQSCNFEFVTLKDREKACVILANKEIRYRTGKTLVPFRISGNIEWGVKIPNKDDLIDLTFWVWPESLWAPISFTQAYLSLQNQPTENWKEWWCNKDAQVVQFIGEDNIYFYSLAEMGLFKALDWNIKMPTIVANRHILFFKSKASSSGKIKPPMAKDLLQHYSPEQLRAHFLGLRLNTANVPFQPKPYDPNPTNQGDPVYKEWSIFTNFLNRAIRTLFYSFQKFNNGNQAIPHAEVSKEVMDYCNEQIVKYENLMFKFDFAQIMLMLEEMFKYANKFVSEKMTTLQKEFDEKTFAQSVVDCLQIIKTATALSHPIAPQSTKKVREYLGLEYDELYSWDNIFTPFNELAKENHELKFLEPKIDFFTRPEWQY